MTLYTAVHNLLAHPSTMVREQAVRTLQAIEHRGTIQQFIQSFDLQPLAVQNEILKAMKIAKSKESEHFLKELLWNHPQVSIKISAAEVLVVLGEEHYLQEVSQAGDTYDELRRIIKHALQEKKC